MRSRIVNGSVLDGNLGGEELSGRGFRAAQGGEGRAEN